MARTTTSIIEAAKTLLEGSLVAFPTETVYGLGAIANMDDAVRKVYALKGRPTGHPMIIHLPDASQMDRWASKVPTQARLLAERLMPGPLTLILNKKEGVGDVASGGHSTIALRVPAHKIAQELLSEVNAALVAPSANLFGRPSPTKASHVADDFTDTDLLVLDGGPTTIGIESTVVDLTVPEKPTILRPGAIAPEQIEQILDTPVSMGGSATASPGALASHYSPRQKLVVLNDKAFAQCATTPEGEMVAAIGFNRPEGIRDDMWVQMSDDPAEVAKSLYSDLRTLEKTDATVIAVNKVPDDPKWLVVADRLKRAAN